jgi:hypothetical protein
MQTDRIFPTEETRQAGARPAGTDGKDRPATGAFRRLGDDLGELREYVSYFLATQVDALRHSATKIAILAGLGFFGLVAAVTLTAVGVVLLFTGFADGLGVLVGGRPWLGNLIVGAVVLALLGGGLGAVWVIWKKGSLRKTIQKYEERQNRQRARYGRSVSHPDRTPAP